MKIRYKGCRCFISAALLVASPGSLSAGGTDEIAKLVAEDLTHEVRPGGVDGRPFWNANARFFMYPPAFDFPEDADAVKYVFEIVDAKGHMTVLKAKSPKDSLAPVWAKLPTGWTTVMCLAFDKLDRSVVKGTRAFWKQAPFTGKYPPAACGYGEFAAKAKGWLYAQPAFQKFLKTRDAASCGYWGMTYPSKMIASVVKALCSGTPSEQDLAAARAWADWLISVAEKPGRPLAYFTPTYYKTAEGYQGVSEEFAGQTMHIYPAAAGGAFLQLYGKTGEAKYLDWAKGIAETYLKLQGKDGSWFLKMYLDTGREVTPNRLMPLGVIAFLESLHAVTKDERYRTAADRAFASIDNGPVRTWCWEGQFEDVDPSAVNSYRNLTKHPACDAAIYVLKRYPGDRKRLALARELLRFAEDQFVCWERPFGDMPPSHNVQNVASWIVPGALEQYFWYMPIDASASKLIRTYLALYRAEGNPLDLAKAKALGDTMTRVQKKNGDVPTHWCFDSGCSWWNCLLADVFAMNELAAACEDCPAARVNASE